MSNHLPADYLAASGQKDYSPAQFPVYAAAPADRSGIFYAAPGSLPPSNERRAVRPSSGTPRPAPGKLGLFFCQSSKITRKFYVSILFRRIFRTVGWYRARIRKVSVQEINLTIFNTEFCFSLVTETLLGHPCVVLRRQCQVIGLISENFSNYIID